jgi:16S rRNA (cytosine967-C5)-methyltransferase
MELLSLGASVTAVDISERRMGRVRENLQRTGYPATLVTEDARTWEPNTLADIVLLDAPCSSTGTLRRHPDIAHLKSMDDVTKLSGIQDQLLDRAAVYIKPGGMLMFVTCSLQPQEGLERVTAFLDRHTDFARAGIQKAELPGLEDAITSDGDLRTLPHLLGDQGGMDGFFVARLVKNNA